MSTGVRTELLMLVPVLVLVLVLVHVMDDGRTTRERGDWPLTNDPLWSLAHPRYDNG